MTDEPEIDELAWERAATQHDHAAELVGSGRLDEAEPILRGAIETLHALLGESHPDHANALSTLALLHERRGQLREAIALGETALALLERWSDEPLVDPLRALAAGRLAYRLALVGDYTRAEQLARAVLPLADNELDRAAAWVNLGVVLRLSGRHDEAELAYHTARDRYEQAGVPLPAGLHHNLAGLAFAREDFRLAEQHARAALAARDREADHASFERGMDLAGLGDALAGQRRLAEAEQAYRAALELYAEHGRDEHVEVAFALHNLADVLADSARADEAERCYRAAIALKRRLLGDDHHELAASLTNLAVLLAEHGRVDPARELIGSALAMIERLPAQHPVRVGVLACARSLAPDP